MWGRRTNVTPPKPKLWTIKTTETRHLGVIKFYTGTDKKNRNRIPWGFLTPLEPEELEGITGDVHFTKWAFNNIPEEAVKRELVVQFSIIAGTNTCKTIDLLTYDEYTLPRAGLQRISTNFQAIADSGAHIHVTQYKDLLHNYKTLSRPIPAGTAEKGSIIFLTGIGNLQININGRVTVFKNVFYSKDCSSTLLSVRLLTKVGGWTLSADESNTVLKHRTTGECIHLSDNFEISTKRITPSRNTTDEGSISHEEVSRLPGLEFLEETTINLLRRNADANALHDPTRPLAAYRTETGIELRNVTGTECNHKCIWHQRLGHASENYVKRFADWHGIRLPAGSLTHTCDTCALGKITQHTSKDPRARANKFLERVHADTVGPFRPISYDGYKYALVLVDCHTRTPFTYPLEHRNSENVTKALNQFCIDVGQTPRELQIDGGPEFQALVGAWCTNHNVRTHMSPPYAHYLNGVVERKNEMHKGYDSMFT